MTRSNAPISCLNSNAFKPLILLGLNSSHTLPHTPYVFKRRLHIYPESLNTRFEHLITRSSGACRRAGDAR
jgi:hypothetical protein